MGIVDTGDGGDFGAVFVAPARVVGLRIIGGRWRNRRLAVGDSEQLRPTPDRVRETLFNWLTGSIVEARCLDLFCGTGALGLEALSRGATSCDCVDVDARHCAELKRTGEAWDVGGLQVHCDDALAWLRNSASGRGHRYDVVFLDPPFNSPLLGQALAGVRAHLSESALVYCETSSAELTDAPGWDVVRSSRAGAVYYGLLQAGS